MKKRGSIVMCTGIMILLITLGGIYYESFVPKLGPLGSGKRHFTVYVTMISGVIGGVCYTVLGWILWKKQKDTSV